MDVPTYLPFKYRGKNYCFVNFTPTPNILKYRGKNYCFVNFTPTPNISAVTLNKDDLDKWGRGKIYMVLI